MCADLMDNGRLDGNYTQAELAASIASLQGYCPVPVPPPPAAAEVCREVPAGTAGAVQGPDGKWYAGPGAPCAPATPPAPQAVVCTEVSSDTPGAVQAPNGKWYTNVPNGNASMCGPAAPTSQVCVEVAAGTAGAVQASNGKWYTNAPNGNAEACGSAAPSVTPPVAPTGGTLPAQKTKVTNIANHAAPQAQPQAKPKTGVAGQQSPLRSAKKVSGTLPFTGAELLIFAIVGAALIGAGLLLRATGRQKKASS